METELDIEEESDDAVLGSYEEPVRLVDDAAAEILILWATNQPVVWKQNFFVRQTSLSFSLDACGQIFTIIQSPSAMVKPGVTGAVLWDSGVVLAKFLEHAVDTKRLHLLGKKVVELGSGCGLVGCVAALLGASVILTDLPDRLKLLKKNVDANVGIPVTTRGYVKVLELTWGDELDPHFINPFPDFVVGSDVIYSEDAVVDLLQTLSQLSGSHTTIFLAGELRNEAVLEFFLEAALEEFQIGCIDQKRWHPEYRSCRVALFVLVKKSLSCM
ncbi:hypothetical protein HPP92_021095 [Vanilla planifolia]|uniref:Uncharacterized protein n=1 Tax=Vanilla planifolia TaxID=51239 RepID=A0A835PXH4_VANPL|nr:hypothetical protein HPP92_021095 [Vanilla planifolia]